MVTNVVTNMVANGHRTLTSHRERRAMTAWLTAFALFVQAFFPLATAWAFDGQGDGQIGGVQVICTANGVKTIAIDGDGNPIEDQAEQPTCPFCVLHASAAILTPLAPELGAKVLDAKRTVIRPTADVLGAVWRAGPNPPRGPPAQA